MIVGSLEMSRTTCIVICNISIRGIKMKYLVAVFMFLAVPAWGDNYDDVNKFIKMCSDKSGEFYCKAWLASTADQHALNRCKPTNVSKEQTLAVVLEYIEDNPSQHKMGIAALISMSYEQAWPCSD